MSKYSFFPGYGMVENKEEELAKVPQFYFETPNSGCEINQPCSYNYTAESVRKVELTSNPLNQFRDEVPFVAESLVPDPLTKCINERIEKMQPIMFQQQIQQSQVQQDPYPGNVRFRDMEDGTTLIEYPWDKSYLDTVEGYERYMANHKEDFPDVYPEYVEINARRKAEEKAIEEEYARYRKEDEEKQQKLYMQQMEAYNKQVYMQNEAYRKEQEAQQRYAQNVQPMYQPQTSGNIVFNKTYPQGYYGGGYCANPYLYQQQLQEARTRQQQEQANSIKIMKEMSRKYHKSIGDYDKYEDFETFLSKKYDPPSARTLTPKEQAYNREVQTWNHIAALEQYGTVLDNSTPNMPVNYLVATGLPQDMSMVDFFDHGLGFHYMEALQTDLDHQRRKSSGKYDRTQYSTKVSENSGTNANDLMASLRPEIKEMLEASNLSINDLQPRDPDDMEIRLPSHLKNTEYSKRRDTFFEKIFKRGGLG